MRFGARYFTFEPVSAESNGVSRVGTRRLENREQRLSPEFRSEKLKIREIRRQRLSNNPSTRGNVAQFLTSQTTPREAGLAGWGARIRTWEWRNQNPLPYHLATPQNASCA